MPSEIAELEKLFRDEVLEVPSAVECFDGKMFNSVAPPVEKPYAVFQVIPLPSKFGQARTSLQKVFLIDFKVYAKIPFPPEIDEAVAAVDEHFNRARTYTTNNFRISIRHEKPISLPARGATSDDKIICRGITFRAWVSRK